MLEGYQVNCSFEYLNQSRRNKVYVTFLYLGAFLLPVSVITVCYWKLYRKVRATRKTLANAVSDVPGVYSGGVNMKSQDGRKSKSTSNTNRKISNAGWREQRLELQIARIGAFLTILFVVSWTPYATVAMIGQFINPMLVTPLSQMIPVVFAKCSAAWDPFVYAIKHTSFRSALNAQFRRKTSRRRLSQFYSGTKGERSSSNPVLPGKTDDDVNSGMVKGKVSIIVFGPVDSVNGDQERQNQIGEDISGVTDD